MDNYSKAVLKKKVSRLINQGRLNGKRIVLFGASAMSKEIKNCLMEKGFSPDIIVDNDLRKIGTECMGITVQKPDDALQPHKSDFVILVMSGGFYREIVFQLAEMGYKKGKQLFVLNFEINESLPIVIYNLARAVRGLQTYKKLMKNRPVNTTLFIAPYTGTGDIYLVGLWFKEYIQRNNITEYVFVVVSGACKKVAQIFDVTNIVIMEPRIADDIVRCRRFLRESWPVVVLNDGWDFELLQWIRGYRDLSFDKMFQYFVFDFDDNIPYELPPAKNYDKDISALFESNGLKMGKTVVLSPYSNTLFELPDSFWKTITDCCQKNGYTVCTNCAGAAEKPVTGTKAVFFPLGQAVDFMNAAGYFIGVRSGLCDIISASCCKKVVLYEKEGFFYKCSPFEYFSLKKMRLCDDAIEVEYRSDIQEKVLEKILDIF